MKRIIALTIIAITGCSEPKQDVSFVAGQVLPATIINVESDKTFTANFRQLNISNDMSNFEKLDAKTTSMLKENNCEIRADLSSVSNRYKAQNIFVICGDATYSIDGSVLDKNGITGLGDLKANTNIYLMVTKSK